MPDGVKMIFSLLTKVSRTEKPLYKEFASCSYNYRIKIVIMTEVICAIVVKWRQNERYMVIYGYIYVNSQKSKLLDNVLLFSNCLYCIVARPLFPRTSCIIEINQRINVT